MLSRPNIVMNHGRPAAGRLRPPAIRGEKRSAARSIRLRRYVDLSGSQSHSRRGASAIHSSRERCMLGLALRFARPYFVWPMRTPHAQQRCHDVEVGRPRAVGFDPDRERETVLVDAGRLRRGDRRLALERLALVAEDELAVVDPRVVRAHLGQGVLDLEQVGEVARGLEADGEVGRLVAVADDRQLLVEAVADRPLADDRELGVDVDGAGRGNQEEACLEVLEIVGREGVQPDVVDRQDPRREEAGVVREQAGWIGLRSLDVAALVADDERVAVEDPDEGRRHRSAPPLADGSIAGGFRHADRGREQALDADKQSRVAVHLQGTAEERGHGVRLAGRDLVERVLLDADDAVGATRRPARRPTCHRRCPAASGRSDRRRRCRTGWSPSCCRASAPGRVSRGPRRSRLSRLASRPPSAPPSNTMTFLLERGARRGAAGGCPIGGLWSIEPAGLRPWIRLIYQTSVNAEGAMSRVDAGGPTSCTPRPGPAPRESG